MEQADQREKIRIKISEEIEAKTTTTTEVPKETGSLDQEDKEGGDKPSEELEEKENKFDPCPCVPDQDCTPERMDFTFGKSCSFGHVRCLSLIHI